MSNPMPKKTAKARQTAPNSSTQSKNATMKPKGSSTLMSKGSNNNMSHNSMIQSNSMQMNNMRANESIAKRKSSYTPSAMSHKGGYSVTGGNMNQLQR